MARPGRGDSTREADELIPMVAMTAERPEGAGHIIANGMGISGDI
jgi:hypothetical protein